MGNSISNQTEPKNIKSLSQTIDDIAIHYILKQNVIDLLRLTDKEYYDNLIILIGKVFDTRLTNLEVGVLSGRINETIQDAVFSLLPATDNIKNKMISNISKFYIKLMMIYSAIVATIDPQYSYEDEQGQRQFFYLKDLSYLKKLPKDSNPVLHQLTNPMNLCRKRITILKNKLETNEEDFIILNPGDKLCSLDSASKLTDEVGIKELDLLYYDIFDYSNKSWKKRSREMEEKYKKDLLLFYQIFTGKENMPSEIKSFKDIELLDFKNIEYCNDPLFKEDFTVSKNDNLIKNYIKQINIIEEEVKVYRTKLTDILKEIFLIKIVENEQTYGINPTLTMPQILKLEQDTRDTIISLYTNCERNFIKALLIFEEIYDIKSRDSQQYRYNNIEQGIVGTGLSTTSFSNFDKTPTPPNYNKEPLFRDTSLNYKPESMPNSVMPSLPNFRPSVEPKQNFGQPIQPYVPASVNPSTNYVNPSEQTALNPTEQTALNPTEQSSVNPSEKTALNPADQYAVNPTEQTAVNPADQSAVNPSDQSAVNPSDQSAVNPLEQSSVNPLEQSSVNPADQSAVNPTEQTAVNPAEQTAVNPADQSAVNPTEQTAVNPAEQTAVNPAEQSAVNPTEQTAVNPAEQSAVNPTEQTAVKPTEQTSVNPAEQTAVNPSTTVQPALPEPSEEKPSIWTQLKNFTLSPKQEPAPIQSEPVINESVEPVKEPVKEPVQPTNSKQI